MYKREDFTFTYDHFGYMIQYKGLPVGGAGCIKPYYNSKRRVPSNLQFYKEQAEITINAILDNRIVPHMKKAMQQIDDRRIQ